MKVLLIIPTYNEESNICKIIESIKNFKKNKIDFILDYIIVNDKSKDNTEKIYKKKSFNIINLIENLGIGGAVQTGYIYAKKEQYDFAIQFDGDGQHDIFFLNKLLDIVIKEDYDFGIGSRFIKGKSKFKSTILRRIGINYLSKIIYFFSRCKIKNPTSGYSIANKKVINYLSEKLF